MCFNANISISTFLLGIVAIIIGLINKVITFNFSLFYLSIISMQLIEFFIWIYLNNDIINKYLSILAWILLNIQPLTLIYLIYPYNKLLFYIFLIILLLFYLYIINKYSIRNYKTTINKISKTLDWNFIRYNYFLLLSYIIIQSFVILYICYLFVDNKYYKYLLLIYLIINIIAITYAYLNYYKYNSTGSTYCIFLNFFSLIIIIISIYKNYNISK